MKLLKSIALSALLLSLLAATSFGFHNSMDEGPNQVERNSYEYRTAEELKEDRSKVGKNYVITVLTTEEYKDLWEMMKQQDEKKVEDGFLTKEEQVSKANLYRAIYDELNLDHGFVKKVVRTDGTVHYKYHSKINYYQFFGDTNTLFHCEVAE